MKKIGLAVGVWKRNYGGVLQAFALQRALRVLGAQTEVISIRPFEKSVLKRKIAFFLRRIGNQEERSYIGSMLATKVRRVLPTQFSENSKRRNKKYRDFVQENFDFSPDDLNRSQLIERCEKLDFVVVGSDQLWRPSNIAGGFFTLGFLSNEIPRCAYATSFGVASLPARQHTEAREFLRKFTHISVREEAGQEIVRKLTGREVPVVCDPSMLMTADQWREIESKGRVQEGEYILCYYLGSDPRFRSFARRLSGFTGLPIVGLLHGATFIRGDERFPDLALYDVGPAEFLNLVRNATFVCTDSFHGTVFSILNEKTFFSFRRFSERWGAFYE
jgi:hypothetical protein